MPQPATFFACRQAKALAKATRDKSPVRLTYLDAAFPLADMSSSLSAPSPAAAHPFDLQRMLVGDETPLYLAEIAVRTTIVFVYTLLLLRLLGKRGVAQLSLFEVTIIIGLGSAVGDPMFDADVPLLHSLLVISIIVGLYRAFTALKRRSKPFETFAEGAPACLVENGQIARRTLAAERLSVEDLFAMLRRAGITQLGEVRAAYLEQSGELSVYAFAPNHVRLGLPIAPPRDLSAAPVYSPAFAHEEPGSYACRGCGHVHAQGGPGPLPTCPHCDASTWEAAKVEPIGETAR